MQRPYSLSNPDGIYFVTFAIVYWIDVFTRQRYKDIMVESLRYCQEKKGLEIFAWCLMSNHIHLIIRAKEGYYLSDILRDLKKFTSAKIIDSIQAEIESRKEWLIWFFKRAAQKNSRNTKHQFWQQDNHAEELISNRFKEQKLDYIHKNPVVEGWVEEPEHYLYSSAKNYAGQKGLIDILFL
ncbi:MAG: transposase [Bacteroidetes bacterium]|nr:MAG: transposase [Bacteroidota bacterium]